MRERGASLVEVVVTLALMSLLMTAFAASVGDGSSGSHMEGASRSLLGDLQLARQHAITEARDCIVDLDLQNNTYEVWVDYNGNGVPDAPVPGQRPEVKAQGRLGGEVSFGFIAGVSAPPGANTSGPVSGGSQATSLRFGSRGRCRDGVTGGVPREIYITNGLTGANALMTAITVRAATGRARLWHLKKGTTDGWT